MKQHTKNIPHKGFTLIEILVTIAVASVIGILVTQVFLTTTRSNTKTEILKDAKQNGEFALSMIERLIRNARNITASCSTEGDANGSIILTNPDNGITTLGCTLDGTTTRISSQSALGTEYLTSSNVSLGGSDCSNGNTLSFVCTADSSDQKSIYIGFTLRKAGIIGGQVDNSTAKFETTVTARN